LLGGDEENREISCPYNRCPRRYSNCGLQSVTVVLTCRVADSCPVKLEPVAVHRGLLRSLRPDLVCRRFTWSPHTVGGREGGRRAEVLNIGWRKIVRVRQRCFVCLLWAMLIVTFHLRLKGGGGCASPIYHHYTPHTHQRDPIGSVPKASGSPSFRMGHNDRDFGLGGIYMGNVASSSLTMVAVSIWEMKV
jgi:hypothetical protein